MILKVVLFLLIFGTGLFRYSTISLTAAADDDSDEGTATPRAAESYEENENHMTVIILAVLLAVVVVVSITVVLFLLLKTKTRRMEVSDDMVDPHYHDPVGLRVSASSKAGAASINSGTYQSIRESKMLHANRGAQVPRLSNRVERPINLPIEEQDAGPTYYEIVEGSDSITPVAEGNISLPAPSTSSQAGASSASDDVSDNIEGGVKATEGDVVSAAPTTIRSSHPIDEPQLQDDCADRQNTSKLEERSSVTSQIEMMDNDAYETSDGGSTQVTEGTSHDQVSTDGSDFIMEENDLYDSVGDLASGGLENGHRNDSRSGVDDSEVGKGEESEDSEKGGGLSVRSRRSRINDGYEVAQRFVVEERAVEKGQESGEGEGREKGRGQSVRSRRSMINDGYEVVHISDLPADKPKTDVAVDEGDGLVIKKELQEIDSLRL